MMAASSDDVRFRIATSADVSAMVACRLSDAETGPADPRMAAYFDGKHHPHQALPSRVGYVALGHEGFRRLWYRWDDISALHS